MFRKTLMVIVTALFIFGMSKMSFAMMCGGHKPGGDGLASDSQSHSQHQQTAQAESGEHKHEEHEATMETTKEAINVGNKICPVSGEKIDEKMKSTYAYEGKVYNFCCPMCIDEFKKDQQKYIKKVEEELQAESKEKEVEEKMQLEHETESAGDQDVHRGHQHH